MFRAPSGRRVKKENSKINLIPILDAVFIFIFFLLMSANFIKIFEIQSDVPIVSDQPPPKEDKKPLALTIVVKQSHIEITTGVPARVVKKIDKNGEEYNLEEMHAFLIDLKKKNMSEETAILEPQFDLEYQQIIKIMDSIKILRPTDEAIYKEDKNGISTKLETLFNNIVFGNIMS
jgi:biopolymer transport protein ExbD